MKKEDLEQILSLKGEVKNLIKRIRDSKDAIVTDSVKTSSKSYPYIQHNCIIAGVDYKKQNRDKKYRKMIKKKEADINKKIREAEYELNNIDNSEIRQIIRSIYFDGKDYNQTAHIMNSDNPKGNYTADGLRMKLKRFFEKN